MHCGNGERASGATGGSMVCDVIAILRQDHGPALPDFVEWCADSYLKFNVCKTKELVIDFRKHSQSPEKNTIHDQEVEIVTKYKY